MKQKRRGHNFSACGVQKLGISSLKTGLEFLQFYPKEYKLLGSQF